MPFSEKNWNLLVTKLNDWYEIAIKYIPNLILALAVFILFIILGRITRRILTSVTNRLSDNQAVQRLTISIAHTAVLTIGLFCALSILQLDKAVTSLLAGAGVLGLALGFAFQDIATNFVSGILIAIRKPYKVGDIVGIDSYLGTVSNINLRTTTIDTFEGLEVLLPNKKMFTEPLINYTSTPRRRLDLAVGVSYNDDLRKVESLIVNALDDLPGRIPEEPIQVYFKEFGDSSINLDIYVWIHYPASGNYLKMRHESIMRIKEVFDENGVSIPFPIRTLDFPKGKFELSQN